MKFSYFKKKITPNQSPYNLVGFGKLRLPQENFFGLPELWLKICWIAQDNANLVFISLDTLYFSKDFTQGIFDTLTQKFNLKREQVIFNASHTHSAPNISVPSWDAINIEYKSKVELYIYEGIDYCANNLNEGFISIQNLKSEEKIFISRRKNTHPLSSPSKNKTKRLPNENIDVDNSIRTITLFDQNETPKVIIYNLPCHPVFNRNMNYSSDFVGVVSNNLEEHVDMAMFLQGFSGDVRANFYAKLNWKNILALIMEQKHIKRNIQLIIKLLKDRKIFIPYTQEFFHYFTTKLTEIILKGYRTGDRKSSIELSSKYLNFNLLSETKKTNREFTTAICELDNHIIISIPAEVNSSYYRLLTNTLGDNFFFLGCAYDMIGYLPLDSEIDEGGYEVDSYSNYGWDSKLSKDSLYMYKSELMKSCVINKQ